MRNVFSHTAAKHKKAMAERLKRIDETETEKEAHDRFSVLAQQMEGQATRAINGLENGLEDSLAVLSLPDKYRRRLKSIHMQERLIQEVRRRERVIRIFPPDLSPGSFPRIFPNEASALRLIGALLSEIHEEWQSRCYLDMTEFNEWRDERNPQNDGAVVAIN